MRIGIGIGSPGGSSGSPFNPAQLFASGEKGFVYDFSSQSKLFQDSAGTVPVTAAGQPIGKVLDLSPNAAHATQATVANQPLWQGSYAQFDGVNDWLASASVNLTGVSAITVMLGIRNNNGSATAIFIESSADATANNGAIFEAMVGTSNVDSKLYRNAAVNANNRIDMIPGRDYVTRTLYTSSGTTTVQHVVSTTNGATPTGYTLVTEGNPTGNFGNYPFNLGCRSGGTLPLTGYIYAACVIGRALTTSEEISLGLWMGARMPRLTVVSCVGNSLTVGLNLPNPATQAYPVQLQALLSSPARCDNWGQSGQPTPVLTAALPTQGLTDNDNYHPTCMIIWEGINDLAAGIGNSTPAQAYQHYKDFLAAARSGGWTAPVIIACSGPASSVPWANIDAMNTLIRANAIADGFSAVVDFSADPGLQTPNIDGVHYDAGQYGIIVGYFKATIHALLGS